MVGLPAEAEPISPPALELLCLLVLKKGSRPSAEELRTELCLGREKELDVGTVRRYVHILRQALGSRLPEARTSGGYELHNVVTDIERFEHYLSSTKGADSVQRARSLVQALSLVRGKPFAGVSEGTYGWAFTNDYIAGILSNRALTAALDLASLALEAGDPDLVSWTVHQGLRVWPTEQSLHEFSLKAAALCGPSEIDRSWKEIEDRYKTERDVPPRSLYELMKRLREEA